MVEWNGTVILRTPRLLLRTFLRDDLPHYAALKADPDVARYLGGVRTREYSDSIAVWANECYERERLGLLAVERREDGAFLGCVACTTSSRIQRTLRSRGVWGTSTGVTATPPKQPPHGSTTRSGRSVCPG
jgi:RimJ/RimL family protein N-acetyltransferase